MFECSGTPPAEVALLLDGILDVEKLTSDQKSVSETRELVDHLQNDLQISMNDNVVFIQ